MEGKQEIDPTALSDTNLYVLGPIKPTLASGGVERHAGRRSVLNDPPEFSEVVTGAVRGRWSLDDITIAGMTGTGAQDATVATLAV